MRTRRIFALLPSWILVSQVGVAGPATSNPAPELSASNKGEFRSCADLLEKVKTGQLENYLVSEAKDQKQILELMVQYQVLLGNEARAAMLETLTAYGFKGNRNDIDAEIASLKRAVNFTDVEWRDFTAQYFANLRKVFAAASEGSEAKARVLHLQILRFLEAIETSPNKNMFENAVVASAKALMVELPKVRYYGKSTAQIDRMRLNFGLWAGGLSLIAGAFGAYELASSHFSSDVIREKVMTLSAFAVAIGSVITSVWASKLPIEKLKMPVLSKRNVLAKIEGFAQEPLCMDIVNRAASRNNCNNAMSIEEALKVETLQALSPAQLAYIGQVDLLMLDTEAKQAEAVLAAFDFKSPTYYELKSTANAVLADPSSFANIARFRRSLTNFTRLASADFTSASSAFQSISRRVKTLKINLAELKKRPYTFTSRDTGDEVIAKSELLLRTIQAHLTTIESLSTSNVDIEQNMRRVAQQQFGFDQILSQRYNLNDPKVAAAQAEEILLLIDRMQTLEAASPSFAPSIDDRKEGPGLWISE